MAKISIRKAIADFREASGRVEVPCLPGCSECCCDSPVMTFLEWQMIPAVHRTGVAPPHPCRWLDSGRCSIYAHRPTLCRAYASVNEGTMKCRVGVRPRTAMPTVDFERLRSAYSAAMAVEIVTLVDKARTPEIQRWLTYLIQCKAWPIVEGNVLALMEKMRGENQNQTL